MAEDSIDYDITAETKKRKVEEGNLVDHRTERLKELVDRQMAEHSKQLEHTRAVVTVFTAACNELRDTMWSGNGGQLAHLFEGIAIEFVPDIMHVVIDGETYKLTLQRTSPLKK